MPLPERILDETSKLNGDSDGYTALLVVVVSAAISLIGLVGIIGREYLRSVKKRQEKEDAFRERQEARDQKRIDDLEADRIRTQQSREEARTVLNNTITTEIGNLSKELRASHEAFRAEVRAELQTIRGEMQADRGKIEDSGRDTIRLIAKQDEHSRRLEHVEKIVRIVKE